jgi:hypothetical protein
VSSICACPEIVPARRLLHAQTEEESRKSGTHDEVDVDGRLVFLTTLSYTGELPLPLELYSSESDESVCESSVSELEVE